MSKKDSNKWIFYLIGGIIAVIIVGLGIKIFGKKKDGTSSEPKSLTPLNKLSDKELEKCLLEDFSRRLELKKYFVFNLGKELIPRATEKPVYANQCLVNSKMLAIQYEKKLEETGYGLGLNTSVEGRGYHGRMKRQVISFMGQGFSNSFDKEGWWEGKIDEKITSGKDKYIVFEKDDEFPKVFFKEDFIDSKGKTWFTHCDRIFLRMKVPTTKIRESKEKALQIIKTDPALQD